MSNWNKYDPENHNGPFTWFVRIILLVAALSAVGGVIGYVGGWFGEAGQVVREELGPRALLKKYEWFKDASAQLDAKSKNIEAMEARVRALEESYSENGKILPKTKWARVDAEQHMQWLNEVAGLKANFNDLAAQYNSAMSKINFAFTNVGQLPQGADKALPREYKPYV